MEYCQEDQGWERPNLSSDSVESMKYFSNHYNSKQQGHIVLMNVVMKVGIILTTKIQ